VDVPGLRTEDLGHGGHDLPPVEIPAVHLVRRRLVRDVAEERRVASLLKRWVAGTLHHHVSLEHLPYYLDEYSFRFNRRASSARGMLLYRLLQQAIGTDPHPLNDLIGG